MSAEASVKLTHNEEIKAAIPTIAGTIAATIADETVDHFSNDDYEFLKFHGCYQQDDDGSQPRSGWRDDRESMENV
jgi:sulfite reductase beta subunit-like hemoprotein